MAQNVACGHSASNRSMVSGVSRPVTARRLASSPGLRLIEDVAEHRRELRHHRHLFGGDVARGLRRIEFCRDHAGAAGLLQGQHQAEAGDVKQRQHAEIDVAFGEAPGLDQRTLRGQQIGLRQQRAARPAADRGGVDDDEAVVGVDVCRPAAGHRQASSANGANGARHVPMPT